MPRILLAEDDDSLRGFLTRALERAGFEVTACADGEAAAAVIDEPWDLLLTDIVMPGMNGLALAAQVHHFMPSIRVIFMSGFVEDYRVELSGSVCLSKPFSIALLLATVRGAETAR